MIPWFERQFDFAFPVEALPKICMRLRATHARLEQLVRGATRERLIMKPDGKWSAQEHAGHLADMEPLWHVRLADFIAGRTTMTPADLQNRKTHEAGHNTRQLEDISSNFRSARSRLLVEAEALDPDMAARVLLHPRMGTPMRLVDHLYFVAEHDDHHLARIRELLRNP